MVNVTRPLLSENCLYITDYIPVVTESCILNLYYTVLDLVVEIELGQSAVPLHKFAVLLLTKPFRFSYS